MGRHRSKEEMEARKEKAFKLFDQGCLNWQVKARIGMGDREVARLRREWREKKGVAA